MVRGSLYRGSILNTKTSLSSIKQKIVGNSHQNRPKLQEYNIFYREITFFYGKNRDKKPWIILCQWSNPFYFHSRLEPLPVRPLTTQLPVRPPRVQRSWGRRLCWSRWRSWGEAEESQAAAVGSAAAKTNPPARAVSFKGIIL